MWMPCVVIEQSTISRIYRDAALYFDPTDKEEIRRNDQSLNRECRSAEALSK